MFVSWLFIRKIKRKIMNENREENIEIDVNNIYVDFTEIIAFK